MYWALKHTLGIKTCTGHLKKLHSLALGLASWMVTIFYVQIFVCSRRSLTEMCCLPFFQMINEGKVCEMLQNHW
jgi:hypothetical protein